MVRASDDEVAVWLERHGLSELLAAHVETQLDHAEGEERDALVIRLAGLYAQLLESVEDPARRRVLEARAREVMAIAPEGRTHALQLAMLRGAYRSIERIAEQHRLRMADPTELETAAPALAELIPKLERLRRQTGQALELIERRRSRATGADAVVLGEEAEAARAVNAQCTFLTAWAFYYRAWLERRTDDARTAMRHFGELLDLNPSAPEPDDVSVDLRATEPIARCILGYALCRSMTSTPTSAVRWLQLLTHERTYEPLREQLLIWRIVILLEHNEFIEVRTLLKEHAAAMDEAGAGPLPVQWLRLVAVNAIDATRESRFAADLVRDAVTQLASRGELEQVFDLARRFGVESLGTSGFALEYVNGVLRYKAARDAHADDGPTDDASLISLYDAAVEALAFAGEQPDAREYPRAAPDCARLIAWCRYFQGSLIEAQQAFETVSGTLADDEGSEALWMSIVCLDRLVAADGDNVPLRDQLTRTIRRFLQEYPASPHAPKLILRRATTSDEVSPELAEELLGIPPNSDVYAVAQRRAGQILYQLFREARGASRLTYGNQYLIVAVPMFARQRDQIDPADPVDGPKLLVLGRRILEVSLTDGVGRLVAARNVLRAFESLGSVIPEAMAGLDLELTYRALRERQLSGDSAAAHALADTLWERDPRDVWTRLANRTLFKSANERWRLERDAGGDDRQHTAAVHRYGTRVLEEFDATAMEDPRVITYFAAVAHATFTIWQRSNDPEKAGEARELYETLLAHRPRNARFLRAAGLLAEHAGDMERAVECWRTLVAGMPNGTEGWFEARFHLISALAEIDTARARAVMDQHRALNPNYGPDPWGPLIKALDLRLPREAPAGKDGGA